MNGGDVSVKEYMKTIKQIENEKAQFKRELMSGSSKDKKTNATSRYS